MQVKNLFILKMWKYPYKTKPYEHQRNALNESAEKSQWAYFMEMGTGVMARERADPLSRHLLHT